MSQRTLGRSGSGTTRETPQQMVDRLLKEAGVPRPEVGGSGWVWGGEGGAHGMPLGTGLTCFFG